MTISIKNPEPGPEPTGFEAYVGPVTRVSDNTSDDVFTLSFTIEQQHLNGADMLHGGMMMSFASIVLTGAAREAAGGAVEALSVNCDFTGPGKLGDVVTATAEITRKTRSVVFLSCDVKASGNDGAERMLMAATGVYKVASRD